MNNVENQLKILGSRIKKLDSKNKNLRSRSDKIDLSIIALIESVTFKSLML
jgi:hypothetical protein